MPTDRWGVEEPEWYKHLLVSTPEGESPEYVKIGLDEFCGRFDLTPGKAKAEIRRCQLWNCGVHPLRNSPARLRMPDEIGKDPFEIPLPEADRYAAILEAEKLATSPPVKHPCLNPELEFHSKRLALALEAWEYAVSQKSIKKNFMQRIEAFLKKHNVSDSDTARIKEICNPWPRGPKSSNKI